MKTYASKVILGIAICIIFGFVISPAMAQANTGAISVSSSPANAAIYLDGNYVGPTPNTLTGVQAGIHTITLELPFYQDYQTNFSVTAGNTASVSVTLVASPGGQTSLSQQTNGGIWVSSSPSGATILIDGIRVGTTPETLNDLLPGTHTITLQMSGYQNYQTSVTVTSEAYSSVSATLVPTSQSSSTGSLAISSSPSGATILIDGTNMGTTPKTLAVQAGSHTITLQLSGYQDYQTSVSIISGSSNSVSVTLGASSGGGNSGGTQTSNVYISSNPSGATFFFNGLKLGTTPFSFSTYPGTYTALLQLPGYKDYQTQFTVVAGQSAYVSATLVPNTPTTGGISVSSTPSGAAIYLDGVNTGQITPATLTGLSAGTHTIALKLSGYYDSPQTNVPVNAVKVSTYYCYLTSNTPTTGGLEISSSPSGATIYLNGNNVGSTTHSWNNLQTGSYTITLVKSGYQNYQTSVTVTAGQMAHVSAILVQNTPTTAGISVSSTPSGAAIYLDGTNAGTTPKTLTGIQVGSHTITLKLSGYQDYQTSVTLIAGQTASVSATLVPLGGALNVKSTPSGADIWLDGNDMNTPTPSGFTKLTIGTHTVTLKLSGYQDYQTQVTVTAGQTASVSATLKSSGSGGGGTQTGSISVTSSPSGGYIIIDGAIPKGTTPNTISGQPPGIHNIEIRMEGYDRFDQQVTVVAGQTVSVSATLVPNPSGTPTGSIIVTSSPSGAIVDIDGNNAGTTPKTLAGLQPGSHDINVLENGYVVFDQQVTVVAGYTSSVSATLVPFVKPGSLTITSNPKGATIFFGENNAGTTPATLSVPAGTETITLKLSGYQDFQTSVTIQSGQTTKVSATLVPNPGSTPTGSISVTSSPSGAMVLLGVLPVGSTPWTINGLSPGQYTISIVSTGYQVYSTRVTVTAGKTTPVSATLVPAAPTTGSISVSSTPSGATIMLDTTVSEGRTPKVITGISPGNHKITLQYAGYQDYTVPKVTVTAGQTASVSATMVSNNPTGSISVTGPQGAGFTLDNGIIGSGNIDIVGSVPSSKSGISTGNYTIYFTWYIGTSLHKNQKQITIYTGKTTYVTLNSNGVITIN